MNTVQILQAGKQLMIDHGWSQLKDKNSQVCDGPFCALMAVHRAARPLSDQSKAYNSAKLALARALYPSDNITDAGLAFWRLTQWNDREERTKEEVFALYDKAIEAESAVLA